MSVKIRCPECNSDRLNVYNTTLITQCSDYNHEWKRDYDIAWEREILLND